MSRMNLGEDGTIWVEPVDPEGDINSGDGSNIEVMPYVNLISFVLLVLRCFFNGCISGNIPYRLAKYAY